MADLPFLGCKISLISKCDIRYEGILYCVDAKESTIALSKVRSYGTETRGDPNSYVAPKNDVYDIIIFRASDVKDLRVDGPQPPGLTDPAIISAHHSYPGPTTSSFNNTTNATSTTTNNTNSGAPTLNSNGSLSASGPSNQQQKQHQHQKPLLPFMPTGSSNTTNNNKADQQQQSLPTINYSSAVSNALRNRSNRPEQRDKRSEDVNSTANNAASSTNQNLKKLTGHDRDNLNSRRDDRRSDNKRDDRRDERRNDRRDERRDDRRDDRRIGGDRRGEDRDLGGRRGDGRSNMSRGPRGIYDGGNRNHVSSRYNPNNYNSRRGPSSRDENSKGDRPIYRRGPMQGNRRARSGERTGAPRGHRKGAPLKFDGEYDFDEANKLFLELEGKFKGLKLKSGEEKDVESPGDGNNSKSPVGQSESGSGYDSEDQNQKDGDSKAESVSGDFYDRTKSFFDNISCEASERSQGKVNKPDWRKERQLNAETFGVSVNYRRGGYRGRAFGANGYHRR